MTSLNQFKLLNQKCESYFNLLEKELGSNINYGNESNRERFGFYLYMLECITNIKDLNVLTDLITDTDFNKIVFDNAENDYGVDAIYIDEEDKIINLFNFKFREKYKKDKQQSINEIFNSGKFTTAISTENTEHLKGKLKKSADKILKCLGSKEVWKIKLYMVSNEDNGIDNNSGEAESFKEIFDVEICSITLSKISNFMSMRPKPIDSKLMIVPDSIFSYSEGTFNSNNSYVLKIPLTELIRMTSNNKELREEDTIEDIQTLNSVQLDYAVLYENVRGFLGETKYNKNIFRTLKEEPSKFFMYNNGLTLTADNIESKEINGGRYIKLEIKNMQVVNGGQTLRAIHTFKNKDKDNLEQFLSKGEVLIRIFKTGSEEKLTNKIAEYTNSQNAISEINLKSLSYEQILIEQYLDNAGIIYARKIGDIGLSEGKDYRYKISLEKFAQLLFSKNGNPDKATNQKKKIFDKYYKETFIDNFKIEDSVKLIERYYEIKKIYKEKFINFELNEQKVFYVLYLDKNEGKTDEEKIELIEEILKKYRRDEEISSVRKMAQKGFKELLDESWS